VSIEAYVEVKASFKTQKIATVWLKKIKTTMKNPECKDAYELESILLFLKGFIDKGNFDNNIDIESIKRKKALIIIEGSSYGMEDVEYFGELLYEIGAVKVSIESCWDGHWLNSYFIDGKKVTKKTFFPAKPMKS